MNENDDVNQNQSQPSAGQPADQPAAESAPAQSVEQSPPPPPATPPPGSVEPKQRWGDRVFRLRSMIAVGLAGLVLGAGAATTTALVVDENHDGYHQRMEPPGDRGGFGPGGDTSRNG
ncbi:MULTISPECIES: hypothetical protein [Nocardioides]|uniref:Uncharacterized protein n=1 Tax=Nocardioides vastitatis TaxID=2568655 RepID=A0ABW0ZNF8_9ACTN|nr:hypothetical protein [Nocardioides sp.]THJ08155.1 hypothetical protein E7Z54_04945 [Nocardioides sp.]